MRLLVRGACAAIAASVLPVLLLRWIPPPATPFMLGRWLDGVIGRRPALAIEYTWVPWTRIAPAAPLAVVAAEDQRFPTHYGFDVGAIRKALDERRARGKSQA